jgi:hypothetical protein
VQNDVDAMISTLQVLEQQEDIVAHVEEEFVDVVVAGVDHGLEVGVVGLVLPM